MESRYWTKVLNRRLGRRRALAAMGGAAASAAVLAACGGDDDDDGGDAGASGGTTAPAGTPKRGGILNTWSTTPPDNAGIDSYLNWSGEMSNYSSYLYPKLTRFKTGSDIGPLKQVVDLDLAATMEQPDPLTYVFKIHQNAKWQDVAPLNGRALTAQDVVWNINLWHAKGVNRALTAPHVESVEAVDATTVRFKLKNPVYAFPIYIGHTGGPFMYPPELKENDQTREKTAASGAFILDKYNIGTSVEFKRNPNYYKAPQPYVDGVTVHVLRDRSTIGANIRTGQLDVNQWVTSSVPFEQVPDLKKDLKNARWVEAEWIAVSGWCTDIADPNFKDERVRQAISVALDREGLFAVVGPGTRYYGPLTVYEPWWLDPKKDAQLIPYYKHDVQKAKQLISAAGFPDGLKNVPYMYNAVGGTAAGGPDVATVVQANLKEAGIGLDFVIVQQAEWFQRAQVGNAPGRLYAGAGHFNADPDEGLTLVYDPASPRSPVTHKELLGNDAKLVDLRQKIKFELDAAKRKSYVDEVQRHLSEKMYVIGSVAPVGNYYASARTRNMNWVMHYAYGPIIAEAWIEA